MVGCVPVYQRSSIQVLTRFTAQDSHGRSTYLLGSSDWFVDVTELVRNWLRVEDPRVASLDSNNNLIGLRPGKTSLHVISEQWDGMLGGCDITVTSEPVTPGDLSVQVVSGIGMSVADSPTHPSIVTTTVTAFNILYNHHQTQFEDSDFGNQHCNLNDIKELPAERATLKVVFTSSEVGSDSTLDDSPSSSHSTEWPSPFVVPAFSHDVEHQLRAANDAYAQDETVMVISKGVKSEILDRLADIISKITAYPNKEHYESVAKALVAKHPCLKEPGEEKEIIGDEPLISAVMERWPALFGQRQLCAEFSRIVTKDLLKSFLEGLDAMVPSLLEAYKAAVASGRRLALSGVLQCLQKEASILRETITKNVQR
ncbi:hypothetical protein KUCAC02_015774 [Chaenocephalus aceratus]|uniref:Uncharacterized protein n=1 Tax=Chaenocephalus aceratus TaxID=36190 RepID=A0ACB9XZD4_CHAAC|nr:hypothetical protein KUCAC02_015774 [Chaenocephalus aceratus]